MSRVGTMTVSRFFIKISWSAVNWQFSLDLILSSDWCQEKRLYLFSIFHFISAVFFCMHVHFLFPSRGTVHLPPRWQAQFLHLTASKEHTFTVKQREPYGSEEVGLTSDISVTEILLCCITWFWFLWIWLWQCLYKAYKERRARHRECDQRDV